MEGAIHSTKNQKITVEQKNQEHPSKFYNRFLYKAAIVVFFFVILPLFPSKAPEFIHQSIFTRNWELLHLIFVGIAISYGLFSRRNDETEKENSSKFDNAQSLVSRFLQVSSFFEDEAENPTAFDEPKVQTWSNQHHRNEPVVVVAPEPQNSDFDDHGENEKPLLLPVRSLKSRFSSNLNRARNEELEGSDSPRVEENVVLHSPIPWRSRSGRMEPKQEVDTLSQQPSKPSMEESRALKSQTSRSISPSPAFSSESLVKNTEDLIRKKCSYKSCPPPPPPPPPVLFQKSMSMNPRYGSFNEQTSFVKELKRSFTSERNSMKWDSGDKVMMGKIESGIEVKPRGYADEEENEENFMGHASVLPASMEFVDKEKESFFDKVIVESDDEDTETEDEDVGGGRISENDNKESSPIVESLKTDEGPDVDKKADEFIAKFREQIRLQRIESIKRSTRITRNSSR
ncbi:uncharacterized protein LOC133284101 [Gastrolobium bilobum]|uniref:uncharacterized protein LOC133284101 n=1 Tax=Gastrolobium bilobum TaxID=150636 RepID=UPI002AB01264|nr:uncharacterized protein LOC133284101 [Gastrolobium bilobum]